MTEICLDASLIIDLLLPSDLTPSVEALWQRWQAEGIRLIAPPFFYVETTSVVRNKVFLRRVPDERGEEAFRQLWELGIVSVDFPGLHHRAWELARDLNRPEAYDAQYLAVAEHRDCEFWTTDQHLFNAVHRHLPWVRLVR